MKTYPVQTLVFETVRELEKTLGRESRHESLRALRQDIGHTPLKDLTLVMRHDDLWHGLVIALVGALPAPKIVQALPPIEYELTPWAVVHTFRRALALNCLGSPEPASRSEFWREGQLAEGLEDLVGEYIIQDIYLVHRHRTRLEQMKDLDENSIIHPNGVDLIQTATIAGNWQHELAAPERLLIVGDALRAIESTFERWMLMAKAMLAVQYQVLKTRELVEVLRLLRQSAEVVTRDENAKPSSLN